MSGNKPDEEEKKEKTDFNEESISCLDPLLLELLAKNGIQATIIESGFVVPNPKTKHLQ